ncbi:MAG: hypothetical protein ACRDRC_00500 [Pseudonocardiaceae bacterium]
MTRSGKWRRQPTLATGMAQITALLTNLGGSEGPQIGEDTSKPGECRRVTIVDAAEHPHNEVELRDPAGGAVEHIGEHHVDLLGGRWHQQAVATQSARVSQTAQQIARARRTRLPRPAGTWHPDP